MIGIEFDSLFWSEEQVELNNLGIRPPMEEVETRKVTIYRVDSIEPYSENGQNYCLINSGDDEYIVNHTYEETIEILKGFNP